MGCEFEGVWTARRRREADWADLVGRLQKGNYTDKDGNKRSVVDIIAENVYFGDSKKDADSTGNTAAASYGNNAPVDNFADISNEDDGDLPF